MVPLSEARLVRYMQYGAIIRQPGWNATCKMAPLSGWAALYTGPLSKNRKIFIFLSYNVYGFAINRIYKKLYNMYISIFRWGSKPSRNHFSNVKTKAVANDSRKKEQCAMPSIAASFVAAKRSFPRRLFDLVCINFCIFGI